MSANPVLSLKDDTERGILPHQLPRLVQVVLEIALVEPDLLQAADLVSSTGCARRYLEGYLQCLMHDRIVSGMKGPNGGYRLGRDPSQISVGDIQRSAMRYGALKYGYKTWLERDSWPLTGTVGCSVVRPALEALDRRIMAELDAVTIADLVRPLVEQGGGI